MCINSLDWCSLLLLKNSKDIFKKNMEKDLRAELQHCEETGCVHIFTASCIIVSVNPALVQECKYFSYKCLVYNAKSEIGHESFSMF